MEAEAERLVELELLDTGKPITQLQAGEIPLAAAILRFYAGAADKIDGAVKNTPGGLHYTKYEPHGVVAGILPWNYPLVNAVLKVAPALAAGNALVLKPSVETPLGAAEFAHLCTRAGVPPGIVNVVTGSGSQCGNALVAHPLVKKISFTGSTAVGRDIQKLAAEQMKPVNLECGGKNAIVVFADADLDQAAEAALFSGWVNTGQLCVSCSRLLVEASAAKEMENLLVEKAAKLKVGDPRDPQTLLGPMITRDQYDRALEYLRIGPQEGCRVLTGGSPLEMTGPLAGGLWLQPTLLASVRANMRVGCEEIFGPVLSILEFNDQEEAVQLANSVEYGLSGSVWTSSVDRALQMVDSLDTGLIWVNTMLAGYPQIPLAPHKMSGTGVELGMEGLLPFLKRKSAVISNNASGPVGWALG
jgi:acyl-CoA reductase-like NAD-dependent aldehyde dehydrogenase